MNEPPGVRERLQREYGLKVLRLSMSSEDGKGHVLFSFSGPDGIESALLNASCEEIGVSSDDIKWASTATMRIPDHITGALRHLLEETEPAGAPLWIRISAPVGLLPAVPWERLLQFALEVPILRLPYHIVTPRAPEKDFDSVICFSSPAAKRETEMDVVQAFIKQIPVDLAKYTTFHIFADRSVYENLVDIQLHFGSQYKIIVYDASQVNLDKASDENPWLTWMRRALSGRSADVVHFICHGCWMRDEGTLALAESPMRNENLECARLVNSADLVDFLNATGAWSLAFSSPPTNTSPGGMRMLQDSVARARPGPVLFHDMTAPGAETALMTTYRFLYGVSEPSPASPAISLYCHPFRQSGHEDAESNRVLNEYTLAGRLGERLKGGASLPAWLAASQRVLEATASDLAAAVEVDPDSGRKKARDFVLEALADYAAHPDQEEGAEES